MTLKDFLRLVREDEIVSIYSPAKNIYMQYETCKSEYDSKYDNCIVIGVETNLTDGYNAVLEINVAY